VSNICAPIVVAEGSDVSLYESVEVLAEFLEPGAVASGVYAIYDATGRLLRASTDGQNIDVELADEGHEHRAQLVRLLRDACTGAGIPTGPNIELDELLDACVSAGFLFDPSPTVLNVLKNPLRAK
jgi:hypothetical protein